jgi:O-antigen ligase
MNSINFSFFLILFLPISLLIGTGVSEFCVVAVSLFFLGKVIIEKKWELFRNKIFFLLFILWIYLIINFLISGNYQLSNLNLRGLSFIKYILFIFFFILFTKNEINKILYAWSIILTIVLIDIYFEFFVGHNLIGLKSYDPTRIASFLGNELKIAHFLLGFGFLCLGFFLQSFSKDSRKIKLLALFILLLILIGSFITGERSNFIKTLFCSLLMLFFFDKKFIKYKIIFGVSAVTLMITFLTLSPKLNIRFKGQIINNLEKKGIIEAAKETQHGAHYYTAIEIFKKNIFFGIGSKNFRIECAKKDYYNPNFLRSEERCSTHPHQIYLEFLSEHGIVGTLIILYVIFYILIGNIKVFLVKRNYIHLASIAFILSTFLPIIPSGSFFVSFDATIFWLNFAIMNYFGLNYFNKQKNN